jgi:carboxyl-terminal processing protease
VYELFRKILIAAGITIILLLIILASFAGGVLVGRHFEQKRLENLAFQYPSLDKVQEVFGIIKHSYVEEISDQKLVTGAINGMIESLNDPYTRYLDKKHFQKVKEETSGRFEGVGLMIGLRDKKLTVIAPIENTPAAKAGIKSGDQIIKIDGKPTEDMSIEEAVKRIRGKKGTIVKLTILRPGKKEPLVFKVKRDVINLPNVASKILDKDIGYIRVHVFNEQTSANVKRAIDSLVKKGANGIVLDLRNNPGGLLQASIAVASQFIESGPIVKVKNRSGAIESYDATGGANEDIPLVVVVNHGSASASEIVAGAIQDHHRGMVVGEKTFGKASVQTIVTLSDGTGLLVTTNTYLTPKGRVIHKKGIKPDVVVKQDLSKARKGKDKQLIEAKKVLKQLIAKSKKNAA